VFGISKMPYTPNAIQELYHYLNFIQKYITNIAVIIDESRLFMPPDFHSLLLVYMCVWYFSCSLGVRRLFAKNIRYWLSKTLSKLLF